jgi:hypothetical protein
MNGQFANSDYYLRIPKLRASVLARRGQSVHLAVPSASFSSCPVRCWIGAGSHLEHKQTSGFIQCRPDSLLVASDLENRQPRLVRLLQYTPGSTLSPCFIPYLINRVARILRLETPCLSAGWLYRSTNINLSTFRCRLVSWSSFCTQFKLGHFIALTFVLLGPSISTFRN